MDPKTELTIYNLIFGIFAISGIFAIIILGLYTEADAAWHQVTVRDTDFTPTHIALYHFLLAAVWRRLSVRARAITAVNLATLGGRHRARDHDVASRRSALTTA